jgi:hypothetical protein
MTSATEAPEAADAAALRHVTVLTTMRDSHANRAQREWARRFLDWYEQASAAGRAPGSAMAWAREQMSVAHPNTASPGRP